MALLAISLVLKETDFEKQMYKVNEIKLSMYNEPEVFYKIDNSRARQAYNKTASMAGGKVTNVGKANLSEGNQLFLSVLLLSS